MLAHRLLDYLAVSVIRIDVTTFGFFQCKERVTNWETGKKVFCKNRVLSSLNVLLWLSLSRDMFIGTEILRSKEWRVCGYLWIRLLHGDLRGVLLRCDLAEKNSLRYSLASQQHIALFFTPIPQATKRCSNLQLLNEVMKAKSNLLYCPGGHLI